MGAAASAPSRAPAAPRRAPARKPRRSAPRAVPRQAPPARRQLHDAPARVIRSAGAGAALLPHAAVRGAGAVRDLSDSSLIMRLTRGRGWIAVLCALLGGIVALNVVSLSLNANAGRWGIQIDDLQAQNSTLRAQIAERLSAEKVEAAATALGLANPDPRAITVLAARNGDVDKLAHLLSTGSLMTQPSLPSSYPSGGSTSTATTTAPSSTTSVSPSPATPTTPTTPAPSAPSGGGQTAPASGGGSTGTGASTGSTGGIGL
jgi:hypothetical protein